METSEAVVEIEGVKPIKPRFKSAREELPELTRIYIQERNAKLMVQRKSAEIDFALKEGAVIPRRRMKVQLGFLLTGLRQRLLSFSYSLAPRLEGKSQHEIGQTIDGEMRAALRDIANWPAKLADPNWQEQIDADLMPMEVNGHGEATPRALDDLADAERKAAGMRVKHVRQRERRKETK